MLLIASGTAPLCAVEIPTFLIEPVPQHVVAGHTLRLLASADPLSAEIQWYRDGVPLPGGVGSVLRIENTSARNEGFYKAIATLPDGACWSREIFVRIDTPPASPGRLDPSLFTPGLAGTSIDAILPLGDGRIAIGGKFEIGSGIRNLAVLDPHGLPDPDFAPGAYPDGRVWALTLSRGRLIAGGDFSSINGVACGGIAALDLQSGALAPDWDHSLGFVPGTLPVPRILTLASDADGRVVAGGTFARWRTRAGPIELPWLARLGADGVPDPSFTPATISGGEVRSVALLADGGMAVAGSFTAPSERFTVLTASGEIAPGFHLSEPPSLRVRVALPLPGGSFLLGGDFTNIGDRLAHILADGTRDPTFSLGANNDVNSLAFAPDGRITIGGLFTTINGVPRRRLARLNPDLSPDESFRSDGLDDEVNSLAISGGHLLAGGNFESPHRLLARMFGDGKAPDDTLQLIRSPLGRMMPAGGALDLTVAVAPVRSDQQFLWTRNGEELARSSHPRLSVDRITPEQSGVYRVEVSDITGSTQSQPIRVQVTQRLPGGEAEFRYRGTATLIGGDAVTSATLDVPDDFSIRNVRLSLELTHPDTSQLEIFLISPDGISVRLFNDKGRRGRDLHATTFDDSAGGDASIDDAQPPYTGTYQPDKPLAPMLAARSSGRWTLRVENGSPADGDLLDWMLELRAGAAQVSFSNYANALGLPDNDESRHAYSLARLPQDESSGVRALGTGPAGFTIGHWRWTSPSDLNYSYERNVPAGWAPAVPTGGYITRFPGGREYHEARFPNLSSRSYFRLRADPTP